MNDLRSDILSIVSEVRGTDIGPAEQSKSLKELGVDSLEIANILLAIEEKFDIKIPDADVDQLINVEVIVSYVQSRLPAA